MTLWTAADAAAATGGAASGRWVATGLSIDTRTLRPGDLFVALTAARDGHDYARQALEKGAAAVMVSRLPDGVDPGAPHLLVSDVQAALEALGRAGRGRMAGRVVAVTGSVGKTTTKEMLRHILSEQAPTHASIASYNNHWGVPLTLARMAPVTRYGVIEIGMNAPGEIAPLARMARPHVAVVTTVAAAHLEAFGHIDGIAAEKAAIFDGLEPGGTAIFPADLPTSDILRRAAAVRAARVVCLSEEAAATSIALSDAATVVEGRLAGQKILFKLGVPGRHLAHNALVALAAAEAMGADLARAILSLGTWRPIAGRGTRETVTLDAGEGLSFELIDDAYNANPASMAAAIEVLAAAQPGQGGRRIAILGDMRELGADADRLHADLAAVPGMDAVDSVHTVGPHMAHLRDALPAARRGRHAGAAEDLLPDITQDVRPGDVVMAKASLGTGLKPVVDALRAVGQTTSRQARG